MYIFSSLYIKTTHNRQFWLKVVPYSFTTARELMASARRLSSSNLRALKGKHQCFSIFLKSVGAQKDETDSKFSRVSFGEFF